LAALGVDRFEAFNVTEQIFEAEEKAIEETSLHDSE
jgi:hypothetical protein